jgi:peptidoglycan/LPS O-acetylase OafA/YrhL
MNGPVNKVHFPNLDGLRLLGSLIIIIFHVEDLKVLTGKEPHPWVKHYLRIGELDVSLFFVLSGFLIGYLLLKEKQDTGDILIRKYYTRRALRIWPLYYFIVLIGFFIFPFLAEKWNILELGVNSPYKNIDLILCLLFLPPYGINLLAIGATWSVRVEEFFYIIEPFLLKKTTKYIRMFVIVVITVVFMRKGYAIGCKILHLSPWFQHFRLVISCYRLSCMAIGGIGACLVVEGKEKILKVIYRKDLQWGVYILTLLLLIFNVRIPVIEFEFYSALFCYIIINLATNPNSIISLDFKWTNYLGKISYGLYLYGAFMRIFCIAFTEKIYGCALAGWQMNAVLYFTTIVSTIMLSILSYEFFEKPFLKAKKRFTVVGIQV